MTGAVYATSVAQMRREEYAHSGRKLGWTPTSHRTAPATQGQNLKCSAEPILFATHSEPCGGQPTLDFKTVFLVEALGRRRTGLSLLVRIVSTLFNRRDTIESRGRWPDFNHVPPSSSKANTRRYFCMSLFLQTDHVVQRRRGNSHLWFPKARARCHAWKIFSSKSVDHTVSCIGLSHLSFQDCSASPRFRDGLHGHQARWT
jgi:hypothetical protein